MLTARFEDLPYSRVTAEAFAEKAALYREQLEKAPNAETALDAIRGFQKASDEMQSSVAMAYIRNHIDTNDAFYKAEKDYGDEARPKYQQHSQLFARVLLDSPHKAKLIEVLGELMFRTIEIQIKTFVPEIVPELQEENRLTTAYVQRTASAQIPFDGKTLTLVQLGPYKESTDRAVRKAAYEAEAAFYMENAEYLEDIFDKLVKIRHSIAQKLGLKSFVELGYMRQMRLGYGRPEVEAFRAHVVKQAVPLISRFKEAQRTRLGVDALRLWDSIMQYPEGNPKPAGTPEDIFAAGRRMYSELSPETGEFMDYMLARNLFDVLAKPGKATGGFCYTLWTEKAPFIFANFNGTSGDIDVLTHEAGHAFASWSARDVEWSYHRSPTIEACEVHSMAMEFFTWPWMELFFGDQANRYREAHLTDSLSFLPYGCMVDEFQHIVYDNPEYTPAERNKAWATLEAKYRPEFSIGDIPWYATGRNWQRQTHIFARPFYYIDYALAQVAAMTFWAQSQVSPGDAWGKYAALVDRAGRDTFTGLVTGVGLPSPFESAALDAVCTETKAFLGMV
jgi:M3 family oligoendopeptidase